MSYEVALPDGRVVEFPDSVSKEEAAKIIREQLLSKPAEGLLAALGRGAESLLSSARAGVKGVVAPEEAAAEARVREEDIQRRYAEQVSLDRVKEAYRQRGLLPAAGEAISQVPYAIAEQAPNIAATLASARLGAMAGAPLGPVGGIVGGLVGAAAPSFFTQAGSNIQRQAAEGAPISREAAYGAAVPQAALDVASTFIPLGRNLAGKALGPNVAKLLERGAEESAERLAKETLLKTVAKGTAVGALAEVPTEVTQQMLERVQAGLPLLSEDALKEYGETAYQTSLLAPIGAAGRISERGAARERMEVRGQLEQAERLREQRAQERRTAEAAEAEKGTPEYALQFAQTHETLQKEYDDLGAQLKQKLPPGASFAERQRFEDLKKRRGELKAELIKQAPEYNRILPIVTTARQEQQQAAAVAEQRRLEELQAQAEQQVPQEAQQLPYFQEPQATLPGMEAAPVTAPKAAEEPVDYAAQARNLRNYLDDLRTRAQGTTDLDAKLQLGEEYARVQKALKDAEELAKQAAVPSDRQVDLLRKKMEVAEEEGDLDAQVKIAKKLKELGVTDMRQKTTAPLELGPLRTLRPGETQAQFDARMGAPAAEAQTQLFEAQTTSPQEEFLSQWQADQAKLDEERRESAYDTQITELTNKALAGTPTVAVPEGATIDRRGTQVLKRVDDLIAQREAATKETNQAFARGDKNTGVAKSQAREAAQTTLNNIEQQGGNAALVVNLRKAQEAALMNAAGLIDDLRSGVTLEGAEKGAASSTAQTIRNRINEQRAAYIDAAVKEASVIRRMYGKALPQDEALKSALQMQQVFDEWVTRSAAAPRSAVEELRVKAPAQMRGTKVVKGAELEAYDPRPLEQRQFGARKEAVEVLQGQLSDISRSLSAVPEEGKRVQPTLKTQFATAEAAKVAEEKGETAKTGEGALRRRRDYVNNLIDQAFQTRRVPGIAEGLLRRTKDYLEDGRGVTSLLDAAEEVAGRIVQMKPVERSDLVQLRDELRAESLRPGAGEVIGERPGQKELFTAEERRAPLGVIRETREKFENAPPVKKARATAEKAKQMVDDIKDAWDAKDAADEKKRQLKIAETKEAIDKQREVYRETFQAALKKAQVAEVVRKFQTEITEALQSLQAVSKERAAAEAAGDMDAVRMIDAIRDEERNELLRLQGELAKALETPSRFVEPAEKTGLRGFALPAEIQAAADEWVQFERARLEKLQTKLERLQGLEKKEAAKEVVDQRKKVQEATVSVDRAMSGLGLPGVRVEGGRVTQIAGAAEEAKLRAQEATERQETARAEMQAQLAQKAARQEELEQQILELGTERAAKEEQLTRAKTDASKERLRAEIADIEQRAALAEAELGTPELTRTQKARLRKSRQSLFKGKGVSSERELLSSIAQKIEDKQPLTAYEKQIWERREAPKVTKPQTQTQRVKTLRIASEALASEEVFSDDSLSDLADFNVHRGTLEQLAATASQGPALKEKVDTEKSAAVVANNVSETGSTEIARAVAERLKLLLGNTRVEIVDDLRDPDGEAAYGQAAADGSFIRLDSKYGLNERTFIHEGVHAATERVLQMPEDQLTPEQLRAKRELEELFAAYKKLPGASNANAKTSLSEFASEALSDDVMQAEMQQQKWTLRHMWDSFKSALLRLLGVKTPENMLEATLAAVDNLMTKVPRPTQADNALLSPKVLNRPRNLNPALTEADAVSRRVVAGNQSWWQQTRAKSSGLAMETGLIDRFAGLERLSKYLPKLQGAQMMYYLRMYDQRMNFVSQAAANGALDLREVQRRDGEREFLIESVPGANLRQVVLTLKGAAKLVGDVDATSRLFTLYLAAKRAERVGFDKLDLRGQVTEAEIRSALAQVGSVNGLREIFDDARDIYNQYNEGLVRFAQKTGVLSKEEADRLLKEKDYIPWYRERNGVAELALGGMNPIKLGNVKDMPHLQELVGGDKPILDFMVSSVQNTNMLIDLSLRNIATRNAMFELVDLGLAKLSSKPVQGTNVVRFKHNGDDRYAILETEQFTVNGKQIDTGVPADVVVKGMEGIPLQVTGITRALTLPTTILRRAVTLNPLYMVRQLMRDSLSATIATGADFTPVLGALKEIESATKATLERRGITGGQIFTGTQEDISKIMRDLAQGKSSILGALEWAGMEADALTRRAQYNSYIKQGMSEMEATLLALESMNFNKRGASPSIHLANSLYPFFNAQIQGLNVLYRAMFGQITAAEKARIKSKLITRGAMLAAATLAYAHAMQDDEAYKNALPAEKYNNWFVRIPGVSEPVRIPIPFEIGYIFKALPEAIYNTIVNERGKEEAKEAFLGILRNVIPGGSAYFIPQAMKPAVEVLTNYSFFTERPLVSAKEQALLPEYQYRTSTTELAKLFGGAAGVSPIKLEALVSGYFSTMGLAFLQLGSLPIPAKDSPERATRRLSELPVVGSAFQPNDARWLINSTFDSLEDAKKVQASYKELINRGRPEEARALLDERATDYAKAELAGYLRQQMGELTKYEAAINASNKTPDEKRALLDKIRQYKIKLATTVRDASERQKLAA